MTRKHSWAKLAVAVVLSLPLTACKDTKTLEENEQLKAHVAGLQKENEKLRAEIKALKTKSSGKKAAGRKRRRS